MLLFNNDVTSDLLTVKARIKASNVMQKKLTLPIAFNSHFQMQLV